MLMRVCVFAFICYHGCTTVHREMQAVQALRLELEAASSANVSNGASADAGGGAAADTDPTIVFTPGGLASATVHEVKEYGIVCDMDEHPVSVPPRSL